MAAERAVAGQLPAEAAEAPNVAVLTRRSATSINFSGTFHALRFNRYTDRSLGAFSYRFNLRFYLAVMTERVLHVVCQCMARLERLLWRAELIAS